MSIQPLFPTLPYVPLRSTYPWIAQNALDHYSKCIDYSAKIKEMNCKLVEWKNRNIELKSPSTEALPSREAIAKELEGKRDEYKNYQEIKLHTQQILKEYDQAISTHESISFEPHKQCLHELQKMGLERLVSKIEAKYKKTHKTLETLKQYRTEIRDLAEKIVEVVDHLDVTLKDLEQIGNQCTPSPEGWTSTLLGLLPFRRGQSA